MKVLWLSPIVLTERDEGGGTWLRALSPHLLGSGEITIGNIAVAPVRRPVRQDCGKIKQWLVPGIHNSRRNTLLSKALIANVVDAAREYQPDIVHVWGTEFFWGLLTGRKHLAYPALLEIQGLKGPIAREFAGGLSFAEMFACMGIKEILRSTSILQMKKRFGDWACIESEIIGGHSHITVQSRWVEAWVRLINPACTLFHTELALRDAFYESGPWKPTGNCTIYTSAVASAPFKGLHDAVRAVAILRDRVPSIRLKIAGHHQNKGMRQAGYIRWVNSLIRRYDLAKNVDWLGPLSAQEVARELANSAAALMPSHCETYSVACAEAMQLGVPLVTSFTGGTAWLARDEESALFYPAGDEVMCAHQLWRILTNQQLAERLSKQGRAIAMRRNNPGNIALNQLNIYRRVIEDNNA